MLPEPSSPLSPQLSPMRANSIFDHTIPPPATSAIPATPSTPPTPTSPPSLKTVVTTSLTDMSPIDSNPNLTDVQPPIPSHSQPDSSNSLHSPGPAPITPHTNLRTHQTFSFYNDPDNSENDLDPMCGALPGPCPSPPKWRTMVAQFDVSHNAIPLAFFAFTATLNTGARIDIPRAVTTVFFCISSLILAICSAITLTRVIIYPNGIMRDFSSPRLINFFFLPAVIGPLVILTTPPEIRFYALSLGSFYILFFYQFALSLHTYGQWLYVTSLSATIYPLAFMQTIGYFLLSILAATLNLPNLSLFLLVPAMLFWLVVFITAFQHMTPVLQKRKETPNPVFFLFLAPPAQATIAMLTLQHAREMAKQNVMNPGFLNTSVALPWTIPAEVTLFIDLFLYALMLRLLPTWLIQSFSVSWWAYVFPLSGGASAIIHRYEVESTTFWRVLAITAVVFAGFAIVVVSGFSAVALYKGQLPKNEASKAAYKHYYNTLMKKRSNMHEAIVAINEV